MTEKRIHLFDIPFDPIRMDGVQERVRTLLEDGRQHVITTPNPEILLESLENPELKRFLQSSDLSIADGIGVLWATAFLYGHSRESGNPETQINKTDPFLSGSPRIGVRGRLLKSGMTKWVDFFLSLSWVVLAPRKIRTVLPERVTGVDSMEQVCRAAKQEGKGVFLLGGAEGVADSAGEVLRRKIPGLNVAGSYAGRPFGPDDEEMRKRIAESGAGILFVAFGCPKQERWIAENLPKLPNIKIAMGVGGSFDFIAGTVRRAPQWMKSLGIEWLYRLIQEPRKRLPRIWRAVVVFPWRVKISS